MLVNERAVCMGCPGDNINWILIQQGRIRTDSGWTEAETDSVISTMTNTLRSEIWVRSSSRRYPGQSRTVMTDDLPLIES